MTTELNSCNSLPPVASVCGLAGRVRAPALPGRPRGSVSVENVDVICMDRRERRIPSIEEHSFIEDNSIIPVIPPPPLIYEFDVEDCYSHNSRRKYRARPPDDDDEDKSIITVKSVLLFLIAAFIIGFIVLSPLLHRYL